MILYARFMQAEGTGLRGLVAAWSANESTLGLSWDLTIASAALAVWVLAEVRARRNWWALVAVPATLAVGLAFALPLYLFLRTRPVV